MLNPIIHHGLGFLVNIVPDETRIDPYRDQNFGAWRVNGAYNTLRSNKREIVLKVNQREYARVLLAEIHHLLNHAMEHRAHLINVVDTQKEPSPSWTFVTLYYFSLFVAMAWTRVVNNAVIFLDKPAITILSQGAADKPGAGTFCAAFSLESNTLIPLVRAVKNSHSHFHDAVWVAVYNSLSTIYEDIEAQTKIRKPTVDEIEAMELLRLFRGSGFSNPLIWPSELRNAINYRPGFSYRTVIRNNILNIVSMIGKTKLNTLRDVVAFGSRAMRDLSSYSSPSECPNDCVKLLIAQTLFLETMVEGTLVELCQLQNLKTSGPRERRSFGRQYKQGTVLAAVEYNPRGG